MTKRGLVFLLLFAGLAWTAARPQGQSAPGTPFVASTKNGDWPSYTGDTRGTRYSPLDQITAANFSDL